jgi:hypothetical protein
MKSPPGKPGTPSEDRVDALLDERFARGKRREILGQVLEHDRLRQSGPATPAFNVEQARRRIRFHGAVPEPLQKLLRAALPELLAYAAGQGLRLRDPNHEIHFMARAAYEAETSKPVPPGVNLPAASFTYLPVSKIYQVRAVLSDRPPSTGEAVAILRVVVARLLGDIFLREEIFTRAAYQEDLAKATQGESSAALEEQMRLLAELPPPTPELTQAFTAYGKQIGLAYARVPDKVRQAYFRDAAEALAKQKLAPERGALIQHAFAKVAAVFRASPERALEETLGVVERLNRQLNFLPPDEQPEYLKLRAENPRHFLRSAKLRLEHQLEILKTILECAAVLDAADGAPSPLLEEQIEGHLSDLRRQNLARPYLVPGVTLSDELEERLQGFPFEVQSILSRLPPAPNPAQAFESMKRRLTESLYQRLYVALLGLKTWLHLREQNKAAQFLGGTRHRALTGQLGNFRFRLPLLESLNARAGIVLDVLDSLPGNQWGGGSQRFPVEAFTRAWGFHVSYRVTGEALTGLNRMLPRFDAPTYWKVMQESLRQGLARGTVDLQLAELLSQIHTGSGAEGLRALVELLQEPPGTLRFVLHQAAAPLAEGSMAERLEQFGRWAALVIEARQRSLSNAIRPGDTE